MPIFVLVILMIAFLFGTLASLIESEFKVSLTFLFILSLMSGWVFYANSFERIEKKRTIIPWTTVTFSDGQKLQLDVNGTNLAKIFDGRIFPDNYVLYNVEYNSYYGGINFYINDNKIMLPPVNDKK